MVIGYYSEPQKNIVIARNIVTKQSHEIASSRKAGLAMTAEKMSIFFDIHYSSGWSIPEIDFHPL